MRIEGHVEKVTEEESDQYYHTRPLGSRLDAWASPQSQVITRREIWRRAGPRRPSATAKRRNVRRIGAGYRLAPQVLEFWQAGRAGCTIAYAIRAGEGWHIERLAFSRRKLLRGAQAVVRAQEPRCVPLSIPVPVPGLPKHGGRPRLNP